MSPISGIYWVDLDFINNCKELQLRLVLLRYSADVASAFPWVVTMLIVILVLSSLYALVILVLSSLYALVMSILSF